MFAGWSIWVGHCGGIFGPLVDPVSPRPVCDLDGGHGNSGNQAGSHQTWDGACHLRNCHGIPHFDPTPIPHFDPTPHWNYKVDGLGVGLQHMGAMGIIERAMTEVAFESLGTKTHPVFSKQRKHPLSRAQIRNNRQNFTHPYITHDRYQRRNDSIGVICGSLPCRAGIGSGPDRVCSKTGWCLEVGCLQ